MKQERAIRTREAILNAAAAEFAAHGFAHANLQRVVERTGLTRGALYGHFASKGALADELTSLFRHELSALAARSGARAVPAARALRELVVELARRVCHENRFRAGLRLMAESPDGERGEMTCELNALLRVLTSLLEHSAAGGDPERLGRALLWTVLGLQHTPTGGRHEDDLRELCDVLAPGKGGGPAAESPGSRRPEP
ncbi:TetR family transcriptional regulator [Streptomyces sp. BBFR51]|uniref:TetR family transcriptional regulator n=1 Tax=Streptomyces sp. BBFR51 TaxID=3372856 RepID=UPI0037DCF5C2